MPNHLFMHAAALPLVATPCAEGQQEVLLGAAISTVFVLGSTSCGWMCCGLSGIGR